VARGGRGVALARLGRLEEALRAYDAAVALDSREGRFYYNRACVHALAGRKETMLADLALALEPALLKQARADADFAKYAGDVDFRRWVGPGERHRDTNNK
jgi:Flp pilus assembly protein TadD